MSRGVPRRHDVLISTSGKGNCFDNAMVETFFKALKSELVWRTVFQSRAKATTAIGRCIDGFDNPVRRHSALNFISPLQFERLASKTQKRSPNSRRKSRRRLARSASENDFEPSAGEQTSGRGASPSVQILLTLCQQSGLTDDQVGFYLLISQRAR